MVLELINGGEELEMVVVRKKEGACGPEGLYRELCHQHAVKACFMPKIPKM